MSIERPICVYLRVSTKKQDLENQVIAISRWLEAHGVSWDSVEYKIEDVESGAEDRRPGFQKLKELVRDGKIRSIVVFEISRISRKQRTLIDFLYDTVEKNITIYSIKESYITDWLKDPKGRTIIVGLLSILYDLERQLISERTKAGIEKAKAMGKRIGRPPKAPWEALRKQIIEWYKLGVPIAEIARRIHVHPRTVKRKLEQWGIIRKS